MESWKGLNPDQSRLKPYGEATTLAFETLEIVLEQLADPLLGTPKILLDQLKLAEDFLCVD